MQGNYWRECQPAPNFMWVWWGRVRLHKNWWWTILTTLWMCLRRWLPKNIQASWATSKVNNDICHQHVKCKRWSPHRSWYFWIRGFLWEEWRHQWRIKSILHCPTGMITPETPIPYRRLITKVPAKLPYVWQVSEELYTLPSKGQCGCWTFLVLKCWCSTELRLEFQKLSSVIGRLLAHEEDRHLFGRFCLRSASCHST
jgi:hypothetical protein